MNHFTTFLSAAALIVSASASQAQIAFSVPVKSFRRAVDRNRLKRQMREVYRKNKQELYSFLKKERKRQLSPGIFLDGGISRAKASLA